MAKVNALFGKATGKVGALVFQVNSGTQIMKEKPAKVSNPNTTAQVQQRAKFKLLSQLAEAFSNAIAMKKEGMKSPRNQFIAKNIGAASYSNGEASMNLYAIRLTNGAAAFPQLSVTQGTGETVNLQLFGAAPNNVGIVVYAAYLKTENQKLQELAIKVVDVPGAGNTFPTTISVAGGDIMVYAYGVRNDDSLAGVDYGDYVADEGQTVAKLTAEALSRIDPSNLTVTVAQGLMLE